LIFNNISNVIKFIESIEKMNNMPKDISEFKLDWDDELPF